MRIPEDFEVTESHRSWSEKKGWPANLPDQFITEFKEYWADATGKTASKSNWNQAFRNWIRRDSPHVLGRQTWEWETKLLRCKPQKTVVAPPQWESDARDRPAVPMSEAARALLEKMKALLEGST